MNLLYISNACSQAMILKIFGEKPTGVFQQAQKYNSLLAQGLAANGAAVTMLSSRPINRQVDRRLFVKGCRDRENGVAYRYPGFVNLPGLRQLGLLLATFFRVLTAPKGTAVICDGLNITTSLASQMAAGLRRFPTVGIVTDVPCHTTGGNESLTHKLGLWVMRRFGSYLLLTEQMDPLVNPKDRPYIVLEGHADQAMADRANELSEKYPQTVCLYAGALRALYGADILVKGFLAADLPNAQLHLYGSGDYVPQLEQLQDPRVQYLGIAPNSQVVEAELKATLLINPRPTNEEFTKYSFPSKNMEYMASGTPVLTTRLPGMPADHHPYVYFIDEETPEGIKTALERVLSQDRETLHAFGLAAKSFILTEKNHIAQAAKVLSFINTARLEKHRRAR